MNKPCFGSKRVFNQYFLVYFSCILIEVIKQHFKLLCKRKILLRISGQHERAVLIGPSNGRSLSSAIGRPFESRKWIGCALDDRLSFGNPTARLCCVG